jgi:hypothetical protein
MVFEFTIWHAALDHDECYTPALQSELNHFHVQQVFRFAVH